MKAIKSTALALAMAMTFGAMTPAHAAGVPVIDVASIAEAIRQYEQMVAQLEQLEGQLKQAQQQYESMTGTRGMEQLMGGENRQVIPTNWQETLALMGGGEITGLAKEIRDNASRVDTASLDMLAPALRDLHGQWANTAASEQAAAGASYNNASERFGRLQELMDAIPTAQDPKAIADLQARIAIEQAMLQNEAIQMQALAQASAAQRRIEERQASEIGMRRPTQLSFRQVVK